MELLFQFDLGIILMFIVILAMWIASMLHNFTRAMTAVFRNKDWRIPMYEFCGQVLITIVCMVGGFWIMTR